MREDRHQVEAAAANPLMTSFLQPRDRARRVNPAPWSFAVCLGLSLRRASPLMTHANVVVLTSRPTAPSLLLRMLTSSFSFRNKDLNVLQLY